ncbi:synaptic vesicle 2-related protein [Drosophila gunungcola]|uniref:synaptic vesicle 2-related protein n=2 Tax=elegans subgroup (in: flies) TaxID=32348 RepID=UPI0007E77D41|nr:synaptic vesicle 2-related protein isoform X2 [Drosophila elegans]XP_052838832.1 synaptic vesicle 2-related protein [Drosophila gunungcola]XP_052838833.1 synaptic vesicle 2-related protein [Drosophila gunungcola]
MYYLNNETAALPSTVNFAQREAHSSTLELKTVSINPDDTYTVQQAINAFGFGWFHVKLSLLVGLCWMSDSMEMAILSILGPALFCEWNVTKLQQASVTTIVFLGMMLSSSFWTQLSNRYGRKSALTLFGVLLVLYSILSSVAPSYAWLLTLRGLVGFAIGCVPQSVTLYAEFLPTKHKGKCVVLMDCFWALGACFEVVLALVVYPYYGWRGLLALSATPLLIFTLLSPWLSESARYYSYNGHNDKAIKVLEQIAHNNKRHMLMGRLMADEEPSSTESFRSLLSSNLYRTTILLWFIWLASAFCYYGLVLVTTELLVARNKENNPNECVTFMTSDFMDLLWITLSEFPGILITIKVIKLFGKKRTIVLQYLVLVLCTLVLMSVTSRFSTSVTLFIARGTISGIFQAIYVYTPEIYPAALRSVGVSGCSVLARLGAMLTPFVAQVLMDSSKVQAMSTYAFVGLLASIACAFLPRENVGYH